jgi:hypothetical protein
VSSSSHLSASGAQLTARLLSASVSSHSRRRARERSPELAVAFAAALVACGLLAYAVLSSPASGDYLVSAPVGADNAAPAITALSHGDLAGFLAAQPLMGLLSLLIRAPLAALTSALGGSELAVYRAGALVCLLPAGMLAARRMADALRARDSRSLLMATAGGAVVAATLLISPPVLGAVRAGHPEEVLAATLAAAALLAAYRGRPILAGILLGAGIGTKDWALIGALPVLIALPAGRRRASLLAAGAVALALSAPPALLDPGAFARAAHALGRTHLVNALSAWWPLGTRSAALPAGAPLIRILPTPLTKGVALPLGLAVAVAVALVLLAVAAHPGSRLRARGRAVDAFALLCLLAVVRCVADTGPVEYYYVALVVPLAVWESAILRRLPVVTVMALGAVWFTYGSGTALDARWLSALTLAWTGALACYLVFRAFRVGLNPRLELDIKAG